MQREATGQAGPGLAPPIVHDVLRSAGRPLDASARAFFEPRFGHDFSKVRIHSDAKAAESARAVQANAYTVGPHIVFAAPALATGSPEGARLMAHELTHVVQQSETTVSSGPLQVGQPGSVAEREADQAAQSIMSERVSQPSTQTAAGLVQRDAAPAPKPADAPAARCQPLTTDPVEKGLWQGFFQQALQGYAGNDKFKTPQAKADAACQAANLCIPLLLTSHNKQVECAVKDTPNTGSASNSVGAASQFRLSMNMTQNSDWGDSFRSALQSTTGSSSPASAVKAAADIADQAVVNTADVDRNIWQKYMNCKRAE